MSRIIHIIWYQGIDAIPIKYQGVIRDIQDMNPDWTLRVWSAPDLEQLASKHNVLSKYNSYTKMHQKIDLGRYLLLYEYGGLSMDIDVKPVRPLSVLEAIWSQEKLVVSRLNLDWIERLLFGNMCGLVNNAIVYARDPLHPVMRQVIDAVQTGDDIWSTTGPCMFSRVVTAKAQNSSVMILDYDYFEPTTMSSQKVQRPELAVIIHEHHMTWIPSHVYWVFKVYSVLKSVWWLSICLFLFYLLLKLTTNLNIIYT